MLTKSFGAVARKIALALSLSVAFASVSFAQQPEVSPLRVMAAQNVEIGKLRLTLGNAQNQILDLQDALKDADAEQDALQDASESETP